MVVHGRTWDIALLTRSACVLTYPCCVIVSNNIVFWIPLSSVILQYLHNYVALQLDNKELTTCVYGILCRPSESEQLCPPSPSAAAAASLHESSAGTHVNVPVSTQWCQPCLRWSDRHALKPSHSVEREREQRTTWNPNVLQKESSNVIRCLLIHNQTWKENAMRVSFLL